jgi:glycosyltransferase involved in cell wall biosynthesis
MIVTTTMVKKSHFCFLTWEDLSYSRTGVLYKGLLLIGESCQLIKLPNKQYITNFRKLLKLKENLNANTVFIIGSPCSILAIVCRLAIPKSQIIYDAGWPLIDGLTSRRYPVVFKLLNNFKLYFVDYLAFHCANKIAVESKVQYKIVKKKFGIKQSKVFVSYTGFNEEDYKKINRKFRKKKSSIIQVIFRGKYNLEAGLEFLAQSSYYIKSPIKLVIICPNLPEKIHFSDSTQVINSRISSRQLGNYYLGSKMSIGQIGLSRRIKKTIPHKFFESIFFEVPYLTRKSPAIEELLPEKNQFIQFDNLSPKQFAKLLSKHLQNLDYLSEISKRAKATYRHNFSQRKIAEDFILNL